jgi:N4-gp56 family major capsid protein
MIMSMTYNDPKGGTASDVGGQIRTDFYAKKALVEAAKEQYFGQLADVTAMPKNMGKTIKRFHYMPILDDRNVTGQGLDGAGASYANGNLYGSSKDVGTITAKIPALTEAGGRVNRVGMKRLELEGTIEKFGFFDEYSQESMDFDSDSELMQHLTTESVKAANEITEDQLQIDLLNGAGVVRYAGVATSNATLSGETGAITKVDYDDLVKLSIELNNNRTPKQTKVISGSRMVDTKVVNAARVMYVGSELVPALMKMTDYHNNKAFIPVAQYAQAGTVIRGEIGAVDAFRIVEVPEMMKFAGVGAAVTADDAGYHSTSSQYDVFPMLVVGDGAFTTVGFQTDGKTVKFKIKHVRPSENHSSSDPYGETGFYSIKWYYGTMILRAERLALLKTVAEV